MHNDLSKTGTNLLWNTTAYIHQVKFIDGIIK